MRRKGRKGALIPSSSVVLIYSERGRRLPVVEVM